MLPANRNPKFTARLNPMLNSLINPRLNSNINPRFNSRINPRFNSYINPRFNSRLNPRFNSLLNYRFNLSVNPRFNRRLNPKFNVLVDPRRTLTFQLPVIFELDLDWSSFAIPLQEYCNIIGFIVYDMELEVKYYAYSNSQDGYNLFNLDNEWIGYWIKTEVGFAEYNLMGAWNRFVVI